jgi:uncharacterized membrane protein (UPF0127 family)
MAIKILFAILVVVFLSSAAYWLLPYYSTFPPETNSFSSDSVLVVPETDTLTLTEEEKVISDYFAPLYPMQIGEVAVLASVASSSESRQRGLSNTPYLPPGVVKLFVFPTSDRHSFWMKDMLYPIDIFWVDEQLEVVHIAPFVSPDSYPNTFMPPTSALYVIETTAGFAAQYGISLGAKIVLPNY